MKSRCLLLTISFLLLTHFISWGKVTFCKGYYVALNGDSVTCTFNIPTDRNINMPIYLELQKRVVCMDAVSLKKHSYAPKHIARFAFDFDTLHVEFISMPFGKKKSNLFLKRAMSGYLSIYEYFSETEARPQDVGITIGYGYSSSYGNGMYSVRTGIYQNFLMQKQGEAMSFIDGLNFKAAMSAYFSDAPEIADKIKKGDYTKKMIKTIGEVYNSTHSK